MLDMFPEEPLTGRTGNLDEPLKERHRFYDISNLKRWRITDHERCPPDNTYANNDIAAFAGGIRWTVFGVSTFLTKHPLVFLDDKLKPLVGPHWASNARVADFTCVLYHYKFLDEHLRRQATQGVQERKKRKNNKGGAYRYGKYLEVLEKTPRFSIKADTSRELNSVNDLVGTQFVSVSRQYVRFVKSQQQGNDDYPEESWSERLFDAFFNARSEVTVLAEQVEAMRRREAIRERSIARRAQQLLVLLLRHLAASPMGWLLQTTRNFRRS